MCKATMAAIKGFLLGMMFGMAGGMAACCCLRQHRRGIKHHMGHALRSMGELVDTVTGMF